MSGFKCEKTENCFSHSQTYFYMLGFKIDDAFLTALAPLGELEVKRNFRRPFFFLRLSDGTEIRGALGDDRMKASFPNTCADESRNSFEVQLSAVLESVGR